MPFYVLVEVDTEANAKQFAKDTFEWGDSKLTLAGVWRKPSLFCDPFDGHRKGKTSSGWTRGPKWGWWVCATCGKPTKGWSDLWRFDSALGFNLLPDCALGRKRPDNMVRSKGGEWPAELFGGNISEGA